MRILVADDHSLFLDGLTSLLEAAGHVVVGQAHNGEEAISETIRLKPDLVLLDISMPGMDGLQALKEIMVCLPEMRVVMLTISDDDNSLIQAIQSGASGYMLKSQSADMLLKSLKALEAGELAISRQASSRLIRGLVNQNTGQAKVETLTNREAELLGMLAAGKVNKIIAQDLAISENTVKYHIKKILQKLNVQNRTEAVSYAIRNGLIKQDRH